MSETTPSGYDPPTSPSCSPPTPYGAASVVAFESRRGQLTKPKRPTSRVVLFVDNGSTAARNGIAVVTVTVPMPHFTTRATGVVRCICTSLVQSWAKESGTTRYFRTAST